MKLDRKGTYEEPVMELQLCTEDIIRTSDGTLQNGGEFTGGGKDYGDFFD